MISGPAGSVTIEPLDPDRHDRAAFSCGVEQVDNYFKRTANKLSAANNARVWVGADKDGGVIGFYAVNAHAVDYTELPQKYARTRPRHGSIPAAYISMIGVDKKHQGKGYGGVLLVNALTRIAETADEIGIAVVMLDVMDCGNPAMTEKRLKLYSNYGFQPLPSKPLSLYMPAGAVRRLIESGGAE